MSNIKTLEAHVNREIPYGQRDSSAWALAVMCVQNNIPFETALELGKQLHANMEQPPDQDRYAVETVLEKIDRVYDTGGGRRHFEAESTAAPRWHVQRGRFPYCNITELPEAALLYHDAGFCVLPACTPIVEGKGCRQHGPTCSAPGKRPLLPEWISYQTQRPQRAQIAQWWQQWPDANIALVTGRVSGLAVLDFDKPEEFWNHPLRERWLTLTPVVKTGRGVQVYFGIQEYVKSSTLHWGEIQAEKRLVIAPPSLHYTGHVYERIDKAHEDLLTLQEGAPAYIQEALAGRAARVLAIEGFVQHELPDEILALFSECDRQSYGDLILCAKHYRMRRCYMKLVPQEEGEGQLPLGQPSIAKSQEASLEARLLAIEGRDLKGPHYLRRSQKCSVLGCPNTALRKAREYVEMQKPRLDSYDQAWLFRVQLNMEWGEATKAIKSVRCALQAEGLKGDLTLAPSGKLSAGGWPLYDVLGVSSSIAKSRIEGFEVVTEKAPSAASAMFLIMWQAKSGASLYNEPEAWWAWRSETKGRHTLRGIDRGDRAGPYGGMTKEEREVAKKERAKRRDLCPICGLPTVEVRGAPLMTYADMERRVADGSAVRLPNGDYEILRLTPEEERAIGPPRRAKVRP